MQNRNRRNHCFVTGAAGFIGFHFIRRLIELGYNVTGFDNINEYYDIDLKYARLKETGILKNNIRENVPVQSILHENYYFVKADLGNQPVLQNLFMNNRYDHVIHLAAQAGVRYSISHPHVYVDSNVRGFLNLLESCRHHPVKHLLYASSSSVYGMNQKMPFSVHANVDHPVSLYAATKKSNELMAHTYSYLYNIPVTGLRFFTVYGPWGRPDMALFIFTKAILAGDPIEVFNRGNMERDFTYVDDIAEGMLNVMKDPPESNPDWDPTDPDPASSTAPYRIYNIGNNKPVNLMTFIESIEKAAGKKAIMNMKPMQPGDVQKTWADVTDLTEHFDYCPATPVEKGVRNFVKWYREFYTD